MSIKAQSSSRCPSVQTGAALITALLLLVVVTIIGVTAMQMTRMQERMAGGTRDMNLALQGSEAGLRNGEVLIQAQSLRPDTCTTAPCDFWTRGVLVETEAQPQTWWTANADAFEKNRAAPATGELADLNEDPRFLVESIAFVPDTLTVGTGPPQGRDFYQVTSRSTGGSGVANTVLRSTYARRF